jgi:hypothetical protein
MRVGTGFARRSFAVPLTVEDGWVHIRLNPIFQILRL